MSKLNKVVKNISIINETMQEILRINNNNNLGPLYTNYKSLDEMTELFDKFRTSLENTKDNMKLYYPFSTNENKSFDPTFFDKYLKTSDTKLEFTIDDKHDEMLKGFNIVYDLKKKKEMIDTKLTEINKLIKTIHDSSIHMKNIMTPESNSHIELIDIDKIYPNNQEYLNLKNRLDKLQIMLTNIEFFIKNSDTLKNCNNAEQDYKIIIDEINEIQKIYQNNPLINNSIININDSILEIENIITEMITLFNKNYTNILTLQNLNTNISKLFEYKKQLDDSFTNIDRENETNTSNKKNTSNQIKNIINDINDEIGNNVLNNNSDVMKIYSKWSMTTRKNEKIKTEIKNKFKSLEELLKQKKEIDVKKSENEHILQNLSTQIKTVNDILSIYTNLKIIKSLQAIIHSDDYTKYKQLIIKIPNGLNENNISSISSNIRREISNTIINIQSLLKKKHKSKNYIIKSLVDDTDLYKILIENKRNIKNNKINSEMYDELITYIEQQKTDPSVEWYKIINGGAIVDINRMNDTIDTYNNKCKILTDNINTLITKVYEIKNKYMELYDKLSKYYETSSKIIILFLYENTVINEFNSTNNKTFRYMLVRTFIEYCDNIKDKLQNSKSKNLKKYFEHIYNKIKYIAELDIIKQNANTLKVIDLYKSGNVIELIMVQHFHDYVLHNH